MNIRIGNDICLYVNLLGNKNLDAVNVNSVEAFLINTSKWKDLIDEQYRESALMADEIECRKDKVKYISRFPVEPAFPGFDPTPYDVCCTGRPGYHCNPFPYVPAYHGYGVHPHTFEPRCQWSCDDMHDIYERAGYKHMDMQRQYDRCRFLAPVEATESKNKVKVYFPAQAQLYTGTYKLVIVAKVYEPGYCKNNLRNMTIDYENVFTLVNSSDQGCDGNITIDVNHSSDKITGCDCNCNAYCCQQEKPKHEGCDMDMNVCGSTTKILPMFQTYTTKVLQPNLCCRQNILTQKMVNCLGYKYVIRWDFDLNGKTILIPDNCILEFDGGTLKNGTIIGQDTYINDVGGLGVETLFGEGITRKGTWRMNDGESGCITREEFNALLEQFNALKAKVDKYHPDIPEPTSEGYALFTTKPSLETIRNSVDITAAKPANGKEFDMSSLSRPTMCYFVYPLSWEIIENGLLIIPAIFDSNGFETGATIDAEIPTVNVNGVTYRILDVRLGKGKYKVNFNR